MLISNSHRFLFVHIYKTAGTSITSALMPFCASTEPHQIDTTVKIDDNIWREPHQYDKHIKASELIAKMGHTVFESYCSFAFIRNPWDWQVSLYNYMLMDRNHFQHALIKGMRDFDEYIRWRCSGNVRHQKDFIFSLEDEQLVNFIGRYEQLDADFQTLCLKLGIIAPRLPRLNVSNTKPYQGYYNAETIELVRHAFEPDINLFKYDFETVRSNTGAVVVP